MATITEIKGRKGTKYRAQVRIFQAGKLAYSEAQTFEKRWQAEQWAEKREADARVAGDKAPEIMQAERIDDSLGNCIKRYVREYKDTSQWQRSKSADLNRLETYPIASKRLCQITAQILIDHVRMRRANPKCGPATALNDLVWIGVVMRAAKTAWRIECNPDAITEAREFCTAKKLTGKGKRRERRPTAEELQSLDEHFAAQDQNWRTEIPMRPIMWFAIYSTRREAEICRLMCSDNREDKVVREGSTVVKRTGMVRDAKHPREKIGNHRRFVYSPEAWALTAMQPEAGDGRIFPYDPKSICSRFTRACQILEIEDLHFHDLRHEAVSRLFERGYEIHEVATYSLHSSWNELKRYTQLDRLPATFECPFLPRGVVASRTRVQRRRGVDRSEPTTAA